MRPGKPRRMSSSATGRTRFRARRRAQRRPNPSTASYHRRAAPRTVVRYALHSYTGTRARAPPATKWEPPERMFWSRPGKPRRMSSSATGRTRFRARRRAQQRPNPSTASYHRRAAPRTGVRYALHSYTGARARAPPATKWEPPERMFRSPAAPLRRFAPLTKVRGASSPLLRRSLLASTNSVRSSALTGLRLLPGWE